MSVLSLRIYLCLLLCSLTKSSGDNSTSEFKEDTGSSRILSRQKRFLIFPDGSSFQLVFCTQTHGYLQVGDIVWFGSTAAMAWELPTDPKLFHLSKIHEKDLIQNRNGISKTIYLLDEDGKVLKRMPYHRKFIVNPAFAKRSINDAQQNSSRLNTISIKEMHANRPVNHLERLHQSSIEFHRAGRKEFYAKLEGFLTVLGYKGKECVLRMLCETGQGGNEQGTFFEEIMRATFTFPNGKHSNLQYDHAFTAKEDCRKLYPKCEMIK